MATYDATKYPLFGTHALMFSVLCVISRFGGGGISRFAILRIGTGTGTDLCSVCPHPVFSPLCTERPPVRTTPPPSPSNPLEGMGHLPL